MKTLDLDEMTRVFTASLQATRDFRQKYLAERNMHADLAYSSYEDLCLRLGKIQVGSELPATVYPMPQRECYTNAWELARGNPEEFTFTEGFAAGRNTPSLFVSHAWVTDSQGQVVDPTWTRLPGPSVYCGVRFSLNFVRKRLREVLLPGVLANDWSLRHRSLVNGLTTNADGIVIDEGERKHG